MAVLGTESQTCHWKYSKDPTTRALHWRSHPVNVLQAPPPVSLLFSFGPPVVPFYSAFHVDLTIEEGGAVIAFEMRPIAAYVNSFIVKSRLFSFWTPGLNDQSVIIWFCPSRCPRKKKKRRPRKNVKQLSFPTTSCRDKNPDQGSALRHPLFPVTRLYIHWQLWIGAQKTLGRGI